MNAAFRFLLLRATATTVILSAPPCRVDKSIVSLRLAVLRAGAPVVVFSVDGALMSSLSLSGHSAAVTPSAVDVVRFWERLGYLVLYVTARPDMQHNSVARWLTKHRSLTAVLSLPLAIKC